MLPCVITFSQLSSLRRCLEALFIIPCILLLTAYPTFAQIETATLSGRITDPDGSVVSGAEVELNNIAINLKTTTETDAQGST
jgi:hypothetical protein